MEQHILPNFSPTVPALENIVFTFSKLHYCGHCTASAASNTLVLSTHTRVCKLDLDLTFKALSFGLDLFSITVSCNPEVAQPAWHIQNVKQVQSSQPQWQQRQRHLCWEENVLHCIKSSKWTQPLCVTRIANEHFCSV